MSRRELARRSGVNVNTICKWAQGHIVLVDVAILDHLCTALQVQPGDLIEWKTREHDEEPIGTSHQVLQFMLGYRRIEELAQHHRCGA